MHHGRKIFILKDMVQLIKKRNNMTKLMRSKLACCEVLRKHHSQKRKKKENSKMC
jgi:hypothetical protein